MFDTLSYKKKFYAIIGISILLGFAAYKRSFKLTIETYKDYKATLEKQKKINNSNYGINNLDDEITYLDHLLGKGDMEAELVQQEILNFATNSTLNIKVESLSEIHEAQAGQFNVHSNQLIVKGSFENLLRLIYDYEKYFNHSRVINTRFFKKKNYKTKRESLYAKILFQNYEKL